MNEQTLVLEDYNIYIGSVNIFLEAYLKDKSYTQCFVLVDEHTRKHCLPLLDFQPDHILQIPSGEAYKSITTCQKLWHRLMSRKADRNSLLINLGGGVIGDMGGFVASTFKRGIDFIQIPTTLLAQVDASIGGKLGIDFAGVKNSVGLFQNPKEVIVDPTFLASLPDNQLLSGYAEILKHALIADLDYWNQLLTIDPLKQADWHDLIADSLKIKKSVVETDPYEKGLRKILNYGHTIGHAIESYSLEHDETPLLHGEAVALGLVAEAFLSQKHYHLPPKSYQQINETIRSLYPSYSISSRSFSSILSFMKNDKKNIGNQINMTFLESIGNALPNGTITEEQAINALEIFSK